MALMAADEIHKRLEDLDGWDRSGNSIRKQYRCGDFSGSVGFVDKLVEPAEEMGHHPDLEISWDTVTVKLSTHSEGGLTEADFDLAGRIDSLS